MVRLPWISHEHCMDFHKINDIPICCIYFPFIIRLFPMVLLTLVLYSCAPPGTINIIEPQYLPILDDDGSRESLSAALLQQQRYIDRLPETTRVVVGGRSYTAARLADSVKAFRNILEGNPSPTELDKILKEQFTLVQASGQQGRPGNEMLVTGYFEPLFHGSLKRVPPFLYPIYAKPTDLVERISPTGTKVTGRIDNSGTFRPYWTREEIENNATAKGFELVYLKDSFEAFLLHVQGSGKIQLGDGTTRSIHYHANNGHPYRSIGKLLVEEKKIALKNVDVPALRHHLQNASLQERQRILHANPRYIFFKWGDGSPTTGSIGVPLTPERSIAIDSSVLPMGMIAYLVCRKPVVDTNGSISGWVPLQRFVLPQDTGSAIKGPGRVDLYFGGGAYAEAAAGVMKERGALFFLILKDSQNNRGKSD